MRQRRKSTAFAVDQPPQEAKLMSLEEVKAYMRHDFQIAAALNQAVQCVEDAGYTCQCIDPLEAIKFLADWIAGFPDSEIAHWYEQASKEDFDTFVRYYNQRFQRRAS